MQAPVPADELASRKLSLIGGFSRSVETTAGLASAIRSLVASERSPAELKTRIAAIEAVGPADVQRYAAAHFGAAGRRLAVAGVAQRFAGALQADGAGTGGRRPATARPRARRRTQARLARRVGARTRPGPPPRPTRCGVKANPSGATIGLLGQ